MVLRAVPRDFRRIFCDAAWHLGKTRGHAGLTVRAIAEAIDVSAALLYSHYEDKAALMAELHRFAAGRLGDELDHVDHGASTYDRIVASCTTYVEFVRAHGWLYEGSRNELASPADLVELRRTFTERVEALLGGEHTAANHIAVGTPAHHLWIGVHGLAQLTASRRAGTTLGNEARELVAHHTRLLLRGLGLRDQPLDGSGTGSISTVAATGSS
jgi:AcrR family transcriptional regulator